MKRPRLPVESDVEDEGDIMCQYAPAPSEETAPTAPTSSGVLGGCGGISVSQRFSKEDSEMACKVARQHGAAITSPSSAKYTLAPLEGAESELGDVGGVLVTMIWLVCVRVCVLIWK